MKPWLVALQLTLVLASAASASTITATASGGHPSEPVSDTAGPADSGEILAEAIIPVSSFSDMTARAALDVDGNSALDLDGVYSPTAGPQLAGSFPQVTDGTTVWSHTITNNGNAPVSYRYSFVLHPIALEIFSFSSYMADDPEAPLASYDVEVRANNVLVFESHALLKGGFGSHSLTETGEDLGGEFSTDEKAVIRYDFAQFNARVSLGRAAPGESIVVEAKLIGHTKAEDNSTGGAVLMGDPLDLKGDPGVSSNIIEEDDTIAVEPVSWSLAKQLYR